MTARLAAWSLAFAISLAVHSAALIGLSGMAGSPGQPAHSELFIGDEAAFSAVVMSPIAAGAGSAAAIAEAKTSLDPVESAAKPTAPEQETAKTLAPVAHSGEQVPATSLATAVAPSGQAIKESPRVDSKTVGAQDEAHPMAAVSGHAPTAPQVPDLNTLPLVQQKSEPAPIAESNAPAAPAPALAAKQIRSETQIASAQLAQVSSIEAEPTAAENVEAPQSLAPAEDSNRMPVLAEGDTQFSQAPAQAIGAASSQAQHATPTAESIDVRPAQETNAPVQATDGQEMQAAAAAGEEAKRNDTAEPVGAVAGGEEVQATAVGGEQIKRTEIAEAVPPIADGGQIETAAIARDERKEAGAVAPPTWQPVESDGPGLIPPPSSEKIAASVVTEAQKPATNTTLAMVAPHPAIILPPSSTLPDDPALRMANFIRDYDGGFCFFAVPRALETSKPQIDGYGSRPDLIQSFGAAFRRALGVDPELSARKITEPQCPAIGFIGKVLKSRVPEITVRLESDSISSGGELKGALDGVRQSHVILLFVDDDGMVHDVSRYLRRTVDGLEFSAPINVTGEGRLRNQLIVSVAADRELAFMNTKKSLFSEDYFLSVIREASASGAEISVGLSAFRVE